MWEALSKYDFPFFYLLLIVSPAVPTAAPFFILTFFFFLKRVLRWACLSQALPVPFSTNPKLCAQGELLMPQNSYTYGADWKVIADMTRKNAPFRVGQPKDW